MYYNNSLCRLVGFVTYTEDMKVSPTEKKISHREKKKKDFHLPCTKKNLASLNSPPPPPNHFSNDASLI